MLIASPERRWRAAAAPLIAGLLTWVLAGTLRLGHRPGSAPGIPLAARIIVTCLAVALGLGAAVLIMRTHLAVSDDGLADHRVFRVVRVPWPIVTGFEVARPHALWGGFCVAAICSDGTTVDLMATRAYSRVPSAHHLDELTRICWSLEEAAAKRQR
jgi:PH (Pleckstrin Homology) domain-containing protein